MMPENNSSNLRLDVLLLISTVLLGIVFNIMNSYTEMPDDLVGLIFEISLVLLFSSYLYLLLSWKQPTESYHKREFEQVSTLHLLTLNGILISVLVAYGISLMGIPSTSLKISENVEDAMYVMILFGIFIMAPIWIYLGSVWRIIEVFLGIALFDEHEKEPTVPAIITLIVFLTMLSLVLVYSSKTLNILTVVSLFIFLPYMGISQRRRLKKIRESRKVSRVKEKIMVEILSIYSPYFLVLSSLFLIYDLLMGNISLRIEWMLFIFTLFALFVLSRGLTRWKLTNIVIGGTITLIIGALSMILFFKRENPPVTAGIFLLYLLISAILITSNISTVVSKIISEFMNNK